MSEIGGLPGIKTSHTATPREVLVRDDAAMYAGKNIILDGSASRDYGNYGTGSPDDMDIIRAGTPLVKESNGLYAPWIMAVTTAAYTGTTTGTSLTVGVAGAKSINKRAASGVLACFVSGPATATGTMNNSTNGYQALAISAINTTTGVLTITALTNDLIAGSIITALDGHDAGGVADYTYSPGCILADKYGCKVTDRDESDIDVPVRSALIGGYVDASQITGFPAAANTIFRNWFVAEMQRKMPNLTFDDLF